MEHVNIETALTALCVWEYVIGQDALDKNEDALAFSRAFDAWTGWREIGVNEVRQMVLDHIAPAIDALYRNTPESVFWDDPADRMLYVFDYEFVPAYLQAAVRSGIPPENLIAGQARMAELLGIACPQNT